MRPAAIYAALTELFAEWQQNPAVPFDERLARYCRERRYIGSGDRRNITRMAWAILRHAGRASGVAGQHPHTVSPRLLVMLGSIAAGETTADAIEHLWNGEAYAPAALSADEKTLCLRLPEALKLLPVWLQHECPEWAWKRFEQCHGADTPAFVAALNIPAAADFRVNTLKTDRAAVLQRLKKENIPAASTSVSPFSIRLPHGTDLRQHPLFLEGHIEPQDESAQIAALVLDPQPGETVIDYCAGAGGKTLAMAALMRNRGIILVYDSNQERLKGMDKRLERAGVRIARPAPPLLAEKSAMRVLVDAPCTGSGTWRRAPDARWRDDETILEKFATIQQQILEQAAALVKPGGRLVYATCSLFQEENESVAAAFSAKNAGFTRTMDSPWPLSITPWHHQTDGFFLSVWDCS